MGVKRGIIFSIDSFVAFGLILIAIYGLFVLIGTPKSYFTSLEQTADYAHDTLLSLSRLEDSHGTSYIDLIGEKYASDRSNRRLDSLVKAAVERAIPLQFGYKFEIYDPLQGGWILLNATHDAGRTDTTYNSSKIAASAQAPLTFYIIKSYIAKSPWCYQTCGGFFWNYTTQAPDYNCIAGPDSSFPGYPKVPCDVPTSQFAQGDLSVGWVRLTVFI